jgi:hypothetical protein
MRTLTRERHVLEPRASSFAWPAAALAAIALIVALLAVVALGDPADAPETNILLIGP